jgi:hypothetical protein
MKARKTGRSFGVEDQKMCICFGGRSLWIDNPQGMEGGVAASLQQLMDVVWTVPQERSHYESMFDVSILW